MKHPFRLFFICALMLLVGCQKNIESSVAPGNIPAETGDGRLLHRIVFQYSATDSSYTDILYDKKGRWAGIKTNDAHPMLNDYVQAKLYRAPSGIATKYVTWKKATPAADSAVYRLQYSNVGNHYSSKILLNPISGVAMDSTEYVYKDGRIVAAHLFMRPAPTAPYSEQAKAEFTYNNAGNISELRSFVLKKHPDSGFDLVSETRFIYDDKVNALNMGMDALVLDQIFFVSANNIIRIEIKDAANAATQKEMLDFVYQYHASNKPRSAQWRTAFTATPMFYRYK